ncbi:30S ribosomal protein S21 [Aquimarina muelleri]|uniref:Small ribosomal subunit protein bS21 n=1 Tax=Aquimarina muelleri TaxID=279356 RepID=A0A918JY23_9FLAO|nr:30S ribosomal protein S21 [Aquimarina muelleri]MCX2763853.1 30S ribosomal protein S21 [Aquimarina muelleri]GGX29297.1 30S ribosomal protein S21 [Aquimarina muelleri]
MLKIEVKDGENIDRAIKRYKRKYRNVKQLQEIRERKHYIKKSTKRREQIKKAEYKEQYIREHSEL